MRFNRRVDARGVYRIASTRLRGAALLELVDDAIEVGVAGAKLARDEVAAALGHLLAVRDHVELAGGAGCADRINSEALLDEGHETRDLSLVIVSGGAVNDLDLHTVSFLLNHIHLLVNWSPASPLLATMVTGTRYGFSPTLRAAQRQADAVISMAREAAKQNVFNRLTAHLTCSSTRN
jgi:hypothetical protein